MTSQRMLRLHLTPLMPAVRLQAITKTAIKLLLGAGGVPLSVTQRPSGKQPSPEGTLTAPLDPAIRSLHSFVQLFIHACVYLFIRAFIYALLHSFVCSCVCFMLCCAVLCCAVLCCALLCSAVLCCAVLCAAASPLEGQSGQKRFP